MSRAGRTCRRHRRRNRGGDTSDARGWALSLPARPSRVQPLQGSQEDCGRPRGPRGPWPPQVSWGWARGAGGWSSVSHLTSPALAPGPGLVPTPPQQGPPGQFSLWVLGPFLLPTPTLRPGVHWVRVPALYCGSPGATFAGRTGSLGPASRILPVLGPMKLRSEVVRLAGPLGPRWMPGACTCSLSPCFQLWEEGGTGDPVPAGVLGKRPCPLGPGRPACGAHRTAQPPGPASLRRPCSGPWVIGRAPTGNSGFRPPSFGMFPPCPHTLGSRKHIFAQNPGLRRRSTGSGLGSWGSGPASLSPG